MTGWEYSLDAALTYDQQMEILRSFMEAARKGDVASLSRHLENGVDVNTVDWEGETAAIEAAFYNQPAALKLLVRAGADLDLHENQGGTALLCAIRNNAADCVKILIDGFADLQEPNYAGVSPLNIALSENRGGIAAMLEEAIVTEADRKALAAFALQDPVTVLKPLTLKRRTP